MSTVNLVLLGLCAVIVQSSVIIVARQFLDFHQERPLSAIGRMVTITYVIFTGLTFLSTMLAPSPLQGLFSLVFLAFLTLFIYLDAASRCLPRCFTLAFGLTGAVFRLLLSPESVLTALLAALSVFGVLWGLRILAYRCDGYTQFGLGNVYLMAKLGMWFSFPAVLWIISGAAVSGGIFFAGKKITPSNGVARKRHLSFSTLCSVSVWCGDDCIRWADGKLSLGGHILKKIIEKKKPDIHRGFVSLEIMGALVIVAMAALLGAEKYSEYLDEQEWKVAATHASQFNNGYLQQGFAVKNGLGQ